MYILILLTVRQVRQVILPKRKQTVAILPPPSHQIQLSAVKARLIRIIPSCGSSPTFGCSLAIGAWPYTVVKRIWLALRNAKVNIYV